MSYTPDIDCGKQYHELQPPTESRKNIHSKMTDIQESSPTFQQRFYPADGVFGFDCQSEYQLSGYQDSTNRGMCFSDPTYSPSSWTGDSYPHQYTESDGDSPSSSPSSSNTSFIFYDDYNNYFPEKPECFPNYTDTTTPDLEELLRPAPDAQDLLDSVEPFPTKIIGCPPASEECGADVYGHWYSFDPHGLREEDTVTKDCKHWISNKTTYQKDTKKGQRSERLWEFIRGLLLNPKYNPSLAEWVDRRNGLFRFNQSKAVALLWGNRKNNHNMTYEKLSRAMRYYYSRKILLPVIGKKLVYKFGPNSYGW